MRNMGAFPYVMQGCRTGTGAAGTICSEPKSESDIERGAATAPRKVVSNSYQSIPFDLRVTESRNGRHSTNKSSSSRMGYLFIYIHVPYLPDLHLTCELSNFEVKITFEILQLSRTPIGLNLVKRTRRKIGGAIKSFWANTV